jgi:iron(III) transport system substrate-binding protein
MNLEEHGQLATLSPSVMRQVPARDSSPAGDWVGVAFRVRSLVYDPSLLPRSKLPGSILDLAEPQWKGKVAIAPLDSDFPPLVGALITSRGAKVATAWLAGMKQNAAIYQNEESVVAAVNRGDVACGVINQYYWYRLRFEVGAKRMHSALYYFPGGDVGSVVNISGAAILASSSHYREAERFVEFLISRSGQQLISQGDDFEYPARPGVAPNRALPPLGHIAHTSLSVVALGDDKRAAQLVANTGFGS